MTNLLPAGSLDLNPEVTRPPFRWTIELPDDPSWSVLDTNPASWQRSAQRLIDDRLAGQHVKSAHRREITHVFADLVAQCQHADALITLVQLGRLSSGDFATCGLHVAWYDSTPDLASLATVRQAISRQGLVEEHQTPAGTVLLQRDHLSFDPTGARQRLGMTSLQAFLPLDGQCWTAVVATATPHEAMIEPLHDLVLAVAGSIRTRADDGSPGSSEPDGSPVESPTTYRAVEQPTAPGIERGFGTLRAHQVDPSTIRPGETGSDEEPS